jgi:hypothetical protein
MTLAEQCRRQVEALQNDSSLSARVMKTNLSDIVEAFATQLPALLQPDQLKRLIVSSMPAVKVELPADALYKPLINAQDSDLADALNEAGFNSDEQLRFTALIRQERHQFLALMNDKTLPNDSKMQKDKQLHENFNEQINGLLTKQQIKRLFHFFTFDGGQFPREAELIMDLPNLSGNQEAQVNAVIGNWKQRGAIILGDKLTTQRQKNELLEQANALARQQVESLLTQDLRARVGEMLQKDFKEKTGAESLKKGGK